MQLKSKNQAEVQSEASLINITKENHEPQILDD